MDADLVPRPDSGTRTLEEIDAQLDALVRERAEQADEKQNIDGVVERLSSVLYRKPPTSTSTSFATATRLVLDPEHVSIESVDQLLDSLPQDVRIKVVQNMVGKLAFPGAATQAGDGLSRGERSVFDRLTTLTSSEVGKILSPRSAENRAVTQKRRQAGELLGLPVGSRPDYRYPEFQLDRDHHKVKDVVIYANKKIRALDDPYGAASWWLTTSDLLDGRSPLEDLEAGDLTEIAVDNLTRVRGM